MNLFAQARNGLGKTAVAAGFSLVPLSVGLFGFARAAPRLGAAVGVRRVMVGWSLLLALGRAIAWTSLAGAGFTLLMLGLFACGTGIALPYASAPRIGLAEHCRKRRPASSWSSRWRLSQLETISANG
jgi:MFS transporter, DHA2 family, multidrug resistance protein